MKKNFVGCIVFTLVFISSTTAFCQDLNGMWRSNQGGTYYIRQIGNEIWWYGESSSEAPAWSNVAYGSLSNNNSIINLRWVDVPKGSTWNHGKVTLEIISDHEIRRISQTGGFGDQSLKRILSKKY